MKKSIIFLVLFFMGIGYSQTNVVTSTTVIYDLVKQIGKEKVTVDYLCRGDQDPHFLDVMPSYMLKLRKADIFFRIGLGLEMWSQQLIDGSRNSSLKVVDLSSKIKPKEIPTAKVDASQGDIHPYGNPHYWLDPENIKIMAEEIYEELVNEDAANKDFFKNNLDDFIKNLNIKIDEWSKKMASLKGKSFVFFHSSWVYFADRYGIKIAGYVEPKPGITPTPSHNAEIINLIKRNGIKKIIMENYYSDNAPNQIASQTGAKVIKLPVAVYGMAEIDSYIKMLDYIVNKISEN